METDLDAAIHGALKDSELDPRQVEALASQLVWRLGRLQEDGPLVIRVGFATSVQLFADLPRLRSATDHEVEAAIKEGNLHVEWVGQRPL